MKHSVLAITLLLVTMFLPMIILTKFGYMNTFSNSIPKLAELVISTGHFNINPLKEDRGLAEEINFRSYYFVPYVDLAILSSIVGIPPSAMKTLPIGLTVLVLWWVLGRSIGISSTFSALGVLFLSSTIEITPGLMEYSQFSIGFIFLLLFLIFQAKLINTSKTKPSKQLIFLMIMLLLFSHFSYYSTEFMTSVWLIALLIMLITIRESAMYASKLLALFSLILFLNNPVVYNYIEFMSIPAFRFSLEPRMGSQLLVVSNAAKAALIGLLSLLYCIKNVIQRNKRQVVIFFAFMALIVSEYALYSSSGLFEVLAVPRSYWIFGPLLAFLYLCDKWNSSSHSAKRIPIIFCVFLLLTMAGSSYYLRLSDENYFKLPDIKHYQIFTPATSFLREFFTTDSKIFSGHDLAFLTLLQLDPAQSTQIYTFGSKVWQLEIQPREFFGSKSILMISSLYESVQPIQGQRNINVRPPTPGLCNKLENDLPLNKIYDDGFMRLFYIP